MRSFHGAPRQGIAPMLWGTCGSTSGGGTCANGCSPRPDTWRPAAQRSWSEWKANRAEGKKSPSRTHGAGLAGTRSDVYVHEGIAAKAPSCGAKATGMPC